MKLEEYFTFYSKEIIKANPHAPYVARRCCMNVNCKYKQKNESHYHCKLCDYVRVGRYYNGMKNHLVSKHAHVIGLKANPDKNSGGKSENGNYSVIDHSYTNGESAFLSNTDPPSMLTLPKFSDELPQEDSLSSAKSHQLSATPTTVSSIGPSIVAERVSKAPATVHCISADCGIIPASGTSPLIPITFGVVSSQQLFASAKDPIASCKRPSLHAKEANVKSCSIPECKNYSSKLKTLLRMQKPGGKRQVDWKSTMLLLTYYKIDRTNDISSKFICSVHWREWYNFNWKLNKQMALL